MLAQHLFDDTFLRAQWGSEYEAFAASPAADALLARLRAWAGREQLNANSRLPGPDNHLLAKGNDDMPRYDPLTPAQRSERMSRIRNADTKPEMVVRRLVHGMGYRYRLHARSLPGNPDLVFRSRKMVIFVHGCFWHQHGCRQYRPPRTNLSFWVPKLARNEARDADVRRELRKRGWGVMVIWECQVKKESVRRGRVKRFLDK